MRRIITLAILAIWIATIGATTVAAVEPGDEPETAIPVSTGTNTYDSSALTTSDADPPEGCEGFAPPIFNTMWFKYVPTSDAITTVDVNSFVSSDGLTDFLAVLFVYRDEGGGDLPLVDCSAYPATVFLAAEAGATYFIMVAGLSSAATGDPPFSDRGGTFDLSITAIKGKILRDKFRSADTFVDDFSCSAPVTIKWDDKIDEKTFFGKNGQPRIFTARLNGWTTFQANGHTVKLRYSQKFVDYMDGTGAYIGLAQVFILDGRRIVADHGKLVFDLETGEVIFEAGHHPQWFESPGICESLGLESL